MKEELGLSYHRLNCMDISRTYTPQTHAPAHDGAVTLVYPHNAPSTLCIECRHADDWNIRYLRHDMAELERMRGKPTVHSRNAQRVVVS